MGFFPVKCVLGLEDRSFWGWGSIPGVKNILKIVKISYEIWGIDHLKVGGRSLRKRFKKSNFCVQVSISEIKGSILVIRRSILVIRGSILMIRELIPSGKNSMNQSS